METPREKTLNTRWHTLFGALLDSMLTPLGVEVFIDLPVMKTPPEADIVLLRRDRPDWTPEQKAVLPDGIRESTAGHVILEFKYTQSLTEEALRQAIGYDYFYRESNHLTAHDVQTAVVSAKTPQRSTLRRFGYTTMLKPGVYQSISPLLERILLLVSNRLEDTVHNAAVKCFASHKAEQQRAFALLQRSQPGAFSQQFWWLLHGLWGHLFAIGGELMQNDLTPEQLTEWGKIWGEKLIATLPVEKRLAGVKPEEILRYYKPEDLFASLKPEEIEQYLRKIKKPSSQRPL
jgi:hypothetical protein